MYPATSERNFTPTSIGRPSVTAACAGTTLVLQMLQGHVPAGRGVDVGVAVFVGVLVGMAVGVLVGVGPSVPVGVGVDVLVGVAVLAP